MDAPLESEIYPKAMDLFEGQLFFYNNLQDARGVFRSSKESLEWMLSSPELRSLYVDSMVVKGEKEVFLSWPTDGVYRFTEEGLTRVMGDGKHGLYNADDGVRGDVFYSGGNLHSDMALGKGGTLYVSDANNHAIWVIDW